MSSIDCGGRRWQKQFIGSRDYKWVADAGDFQVCSTPKKFWSLFGQQSDGGWMCVAQGFYCAELAMAAAQDVAVL